MAEIPSNIPTFSQALSQLAENVGIILDDALHAKVMALQRHQRKNLRLELVCRIFDDVHLRHVAVENLDAWLFRRLLKDLTPVPPHNKPPKSEAAALHQAAALMVAIAEYRTYIADAMALAQRIMADIRTDSILTPPATPQTTLTSPPLSPVAQSQEPVVSTPAPKSALPAQPAVGEAPCATAKPSEHGNFAEFLTTVIVTRLHDHLVCVQLVDTSKMSVELPFFMHAGSTVVVETVMKKIVHTELVRSRVVTNLGDQIPNLQEADARWLDAQIALGSASPLRVKWEEILNTIRQRAVATAKQPKKMHQTNTNIWQFFLAEAKKHGLPEPQLSDLDTMMELVLINQARFQKMREQIALDFDQEMGNRCSNGSGVRTGVTRDSLVKMIEDFKGSIGELVVLKHVIERQASIEFVKGLLNVIGQTDAGRRQRAPHIFNLALHMAEVG